MSHHEWTALSRNEEKGLGAGVQGVGMREEGYKDWRLDFRWEGDGCEVQLQVQGSVIDFSL